jgi:hypothetical protein
MIVMVLACVVLVLTLVIHILDYWLRPKKTTSSKVLLVLGVGAVMAVGGLFYLQMPVRDSNNLYQSNTPVATVHDPKLDKEKKTITFAEARTPTGMRLDVDSIFEYRYWKLRCSGQPQDAAASRLPQPLSYPNLVCHIEGYR